MWPFNHLRKKNFHLLPKVPHLQSLSALRCRGDPIPLRFTVSGRSHPSPLCGVGARPSFSDLRCRGETIPRALRYRDDPTPLRYAESGRDHPSPICGVGAIPSLSALRCRVDPIPLRSIMTTKSMESAKNVWILCKIV